MWKVLKPKKATEKIVEETTMYQAYGERRIWVGWNNTGIRRTVKTIPVPG